MDRFNRLRRSPYFASLFAHVHPLFWPVLYWSLSRLFAWVERTGYVNVLYETSWCGLIRIVHLGDKRPDPDAWRPYEPTKPRWDHPVWQTAVPLHAAALSDEAIAPCAAPSSPARGGGVWPQSGQTEGEVPFAYAFLPNTS